jgi:hypothetical protein
MDITIEDLGNSIYKVIAKYQYLMLMNSMIL